MATLLVLLMLAAPRADVVFADFEGEGFGAWKATGEAFGKGPAAGTLPDQMPVSGFKGKRLVNSYHGGDRTTGTLTSPEFTVSRAFISFLVGGGGHAGRTCVNLIVGGKVVRTATGPPEGSEHLEEGGWDVSPWEGKSATLQAVDSETGGWGHILLDHVVFTDTRPASLVPAKREIVAEKRYLHLPVKNGARERRVTVSVGGEAARRFTIELADGPPDWWAFLDISAWKGKALTIEAERLPAGAKGLEAITQGDVIKADGLYKEALRPQLHFSSRRGWLNDPNGLVYHEGTYHLFYQHNPYGTRWGNMHWGHAVSRDLVRWEERPIALYPDSMGPMFSGSAVFDAENMSVLGKGGKGPLILAYTAFGPPATQCLAYSNDAGRTWEKYAKNPVLKNIAPEDRDPKIIWHAPTKRWVMVLYVGPRGKDGKVTHSIQFFTSPDLKEWTYRSKVDGLFECPDLFELPVDGDAMKKKWVLTAASSEYMVGSFDGVTFKPETGKLPGHRGRGFYAAQTFSGIPDKDGRVIQVGWGQMPSPGMPFNQMMCLPCELGLKTMPDGPRLTWKPVKEAETLRARTHRVKPMELKPGAEIPLAGVKAELAEVRLEAELAEGAELLLDIRGVKVRYDPKKQDLYVEKHKTWAPLLGGKLRLTALVDRTSLTIWASDGLIYVPFPVIPKAEDRSLGLSARGGAVKVTALVAHELKGIWAGVK